MPLMPESTTLLNDNTIDLIIGVGMVVLTLTKSLSETLRYYSFPPQHWKHIKTNNLLERVNKEIRRRTQVVGSFPNSKSALILVSARLRHIMSSKWGSIRYMNMQLLFDAERNNEPIAI